MPLFATWPRRALAGELAEKGRERTSAIDGVPDGLPALLRAQRISAKAAKVGFDWTSPAQVIEKIDEETAEVRAALAGGDPARIGEEIGDLLFAVANLARHVKVDPDQALRRTNVKFTQRFAHIERALAAEGRKPAEASLEEMEALWQEAKGR